MCLKVLVHVKFVLRFDEIGAMWACMRGRESSYGSSKRS